MADKPIIFSAPMVNALLAGRKTQTRREHPPEPRFEPTGCNPAGLEDRTRWWDYWAMDRSETHRFKLPYAVGDRLWVREAFSYETLDVDRNGFMPPWYWADGNPMSGDFTRPKSPIHMPRWASRLTLTVTDVRVQRLQEISEADAWAEGCKPGELNDRGEPFPAEEPHPKCGWVGWDCARDWYADLWDSLHGPDAWDANPWVAAYTFTVQHGNIDTQGDPQ